MPAPNCSKGNPMKSFIDLAPDTQFPLQNLPYGVFSPQPEGAKRVGVAIGDQVLDLAAAAARGIFDDAGLEQAFAQPSLNRFMGMGRGVWQRSRRSLQRYLSADNHSLAQDAPARAALFYPQDAVTLHLPIEIGDYTDFYSSREHATNVGAMFRDPDKALLPNWLHLPVAYHGRASSVVVSGTDIRRPYGQIMPRGADAPLFMPSRRMDFELEMGCIIGSGNPLGSPIPIDEALDHVFGLVLVNDWSARDIQAWEYQPLGPFLAKNLATSISPWVISLEALEPFRSPAPIQQPEPLPYLRERERFSYDIRLEVTLQSADQPQAARLCQSNFRYLYWTLAQQIAHHTITGCNLRPGDLLASGTISGPAPEAYGSLLELTWGGKNPLTLPGGETRRFLEDGDSISMTGWCQGEGYRVGFGEVRGTLLPAQPSSEAQAVGDR